MEFAMTLWVICSVIFTFVATAANGVYGTAAGFAVSAVFFPFMWALGAVISS